MIIKPRIKPFTHNFIEAPPPLERIDGGPFRTYKTPTGEYYPSVTSVLSVMPHDELDAWRARVGEEAAALEGARAAKRGTLVHAMAEHYLKNEEVDFSPIIVADFMALKKILDEHVDNIQALELPVYSDRLKIAGTTDCVAAYDGVDSLIDFKTSKRLKTADDIEGYFLQTSAYCMMIYERFGILLKDIVILMAVDGGECLVFKEKSAKYIEKFFELRKKFKEIHSL